MKLQEVKTAADYLTYFNRKSDELQLSRYPKVIAYYQSLCQSFLDISASDKALFERLRELLLVEAKLQILLILMEEERLYDAYLTEDEVIKMAEADSHCFYREMAGLKKNAPISWSMVYLGEEIKED